MTTTPPLPRASDQAAERALFEATEIAYWQSQQPAHADPLTDKEKAYLLRPNTWDKTSYEACDGRWQGWQWRAAIAHSAAQAPEASPLTAQQLEPLLKHWFGLDKCDGLFNTERLLAFANAVRAAQGAGTAPVSFTPEMREAAKTAWACNFDGVEAGLEAAYVAALATHPAPVSTAAAVETRWPRNIPRGVYFCEEHDNFYSVDGAQGMGQGFYERWIERKSEFPTSPVATWEALEGYGSASESGELDQAAYAVGMDRAIDAAQSRAQSDTTGGSDA